VTGHPEIGVQRGEGQPPKRRRGSVLGPSGRGRLRKDRVGGAGLNKTWGTGLKCNHENVKRAMVSELNGSGGHGEPRSSVLKIREKRNSQTTRGLQHRHRPSRFSNKVLLEKRWGA